MLKKLLVVSLLCMICGGTGIVDSMESSMQEIKNEFFDSEEYTEEEKEFIWNEAYNVVEDHLSNLSFGGSSYDK